MVHMTSCAGCRGGCRIRLREGLANKVTENKDWKKWVNQPWGYLEKEHWKQIKTPWVRSEFYGSRTFERASDRNEASKSGRISLTFPFHFHALEKEMATHSSILAWRIPGTGEPGGLPSMGSHRVRHDWSNLAAAAAAAAARVVGNEGRRIVGLKSDRAWKSLWRLSLETTY